MTDDLDRLAADFGRLSATVVVGARDERSARLLGYAEFGTRTAPARPAVSRAYDAHLGAVDRSIDRAVARVADGVSHATGTAILHDVGEDLREVFVDALKSNTPPPLAASTLRGRRRRGNLDTRSLIDRSLLQPGEVALVDSITVAVARGAHKFKSE